jgi:hypothetical protein
MCALGVCHSNGAQSSCNTKYRKNEHPVKPKINNNNNNEVL